MSFLNSKSGMGIWLQNEQKVRVLGLRTRMEVGTRIRAATPIETLYRRWRVDKEKEVLFLSGTLPEG